MIQNSRLPSPGTSPLQKAQPIESRTLSTGEQTDGMDIPEQIIMEEPNIPEPEPELQTESTFTSTKVNPAKAKEQSMDKLNSQEEQQQKKIGKTDMDIQAIISIDPKVISVKVVNSANTSEIAKDIIKTQQDETQEMSVLEDNATQDSSNIDTPEELSKVMNQIKEGNLKEEKYPKILKYQKAVLGKGLERLKGELKKESKQEDKAELKSQIKEIKINLGRVEHNLKIETKLIDKRKELETAKQELATLKTRPLSNIKAIKEKETKIAGLGKGIAKLENNLKIDYQKLTETAGLKKINSSYTPDKSLKRLAMSISYPVESQSKILKYLKDNGVTDPKKLETITKMIEQGKKYGATTISIRWNLSSDKIKEYNSVKNPHENKKIIENKQNYRFSSVSAMALVH